MKNVLVSLFCAAILAAPALAGGDCCSKQTAQAAPAAACAKDGKAAKGDCCSDKVAKTEQATEQKASCCSDKQQAKAPEKACNSCSTASWMMDKPNADCKSCQSASL